MIPRTIREALELKPGDDFELIRRKDEVILRRIGARPRRKLSEHLSALHRLTVVTRNTDHFSQVDTLNPFLG